MLFTIVFLALLVVVPVLAWILPRSLPRFCGYVLGPISLAAWIVVFGYCFFGGWILVDLNQRTDAWGPWQIVVIAVWLVLASWFVASVVLVVRGRAAAKRLAAHVEHDGG